VQQIQENLYSNAPDGLSGNEDCGTNERVARLERDGHVPRFVQVQDQLVAGYSLIFFHADFTTAKARQFLGEESIAY
jgi:hypothetical protein